MKFFPSRSEKEQRGIALFMAIFALMLAAAISVGFVYMSNSETLIQANYKSSQIAYFAARAGLEEARARAQPGLTNALTMPTAVPCLGAGCGVNVIYILNPKNSETVAPWDYQNAYWDETLCKANYTGFNLTNTQGSKCDNADFHTKMNTTTWYSSVASESPGTGAADALDFKWVRVAVKTNKSNSPNISGSYPYAVTTTTGQDNTPICWDGTNEIPLVAITGPPPTCVTQLTTANFQGVYMVTALAVTSSGAKRVLQMEIGQTPPFFTNSAVNASDNVTLKGNMQTVGYDVCSCNCVVSHSPSCDGPPPTTPAGAPGTCGTSKNTIYATGTVDTPSGSETFLATGGNGISQNNATNGLPYSIDQLVSKYSSQANTINLGASLGCSGSWPSANCSGSPAAGDLGTPPSPWPPSPLWNDSSAVCKTVYIPGSIGMNGASGCGIMVVDGDLTLHGGFNFYGLLIVHGDVDFTGGAGGSNVIGAMIAGNRTTLDDKLGGSAGFFYSSCALNKAAGSPVPAIISQHELIY